MKLKWLIIDVVFGCLRRRQGLNLRQEVQPAIHMKEKMEILSSTEANSRNGLYQSSHVESDGLSRFCPANRDFSELKLHPAIMHNPLI